MDKVVLILGLKIFIVRIIEISVATTREMLTYKNKRIVAPLLGFVETFIWFTIVKQAINYEGNNILIAIFYASGFAFGTLIGSYVAKKILKETSSIQVITSNKNLIDEIRKEGYAVSVINVTGQDNHHKYMLIMEVNNKTIKTLNKRINELDEHAFVIIKESSRVYNGLIR